MWWSSIPICANWLLKICLSVCYVVGVCEPICANWLLKITPFRLFCSLCMELLLPELSITGGKNLIFLVLLYSVLELDSGFNF